MIFTYEQRTTTTKYFISLVSFLLALFIIFEAPQNNFLRIHEVHEKEMIMIELEY